MLPGATIAEHLSFGLSFATLATGTNEEGEARRNLQSTQLETVQLYVADQLDGRTEGTVTTAIVDGVLTTKILGDCASSRPTLEPIVNDLLDSLDSLFGIPFQAATLPCGFDVVHAP